jgi:hypothetical protein
MIKGVTKKIIEINNPDSIYFEKAVFYLRPNVRELPQEVSRAEAQRYIARLGLEYNRKRRKSSICGKIVLSAVSLIFAAALIFIFIH